MLCYFIWLLFVLLVSTYEKNIRFSLKVWTLFDTEPGGVIYENLGNC